MGKQSGLGDRLLAGGFDISGDIQALDNIHGGPALGDFTDITQSAHERKGLLRDGGMGFTEFFDAGNAHPVLSALPTTDEIMTYLRGTTLGNPTACLNSKQIGYDPNRGADGSLILKTEGQGTGFGLEWGVQLTAGLRTDTTATNGTAIDGGNGFATPAVPASGTPAANTSPLPAQVTVSGGTVSNVAVNGVSVGTGDGTYTVPAGQSITLTYSAAPAWAWALQTSFGAQAYLHVTGFTGTSVTVAVQDSADNSTFAAVAGLAFTAVTAAPNAQRIAIANTSTVRRYVRAVTTGTFTSATFAVAFMRNPVAGVTF